MIKAFLSAMRCHQFSLSTESELQAQMATVMTNCGISFSKECWLDKKNRPDFMVDGYAVEVKIGGTHQGRMSAIGIYKQCERYAMFEQVKGIVLVTNRAMGLPQEINSKPAWLISLGSSWL